MNLTSTKLNPGSSFYPLGNTPAVSLTQDLPPEQEADILLLACGDVRNVLFTCFASNSRKIDVTCCDIEPMIHARNVLLYTLLIDDCNVDFVWDIYFNWKINKNSLSLLESQSDKLLLLAESIDVWHGSEYGSSIRFCDEETLSSVKSFWAGFTSLQRDEEKLQAAETKRQDCRGEHSFNDPLGYRSAFPVRLNDNAVDDLANVFGEWWMNGTVPSSNLSAKSLHLNPALLYSPNARNVFPAMSPLGGIPLSTAYTLVDEGSPFHQENIDIMTTDHLVVCAKSHFKQWASSYRRAVINGSVIRIFLGDALAFCFTLRNCKLTGSTSMNLSQHFFTSTPLILHHSDYGPNVNHAAPLSFDVIDTSNLIDYTGPLSLIALGSCLLKNRVSSSFYTESLTLNDISPVYRFTNLFGIDVKSLSLLLGLVPPDSFTNATNTVEEHRNVGITSSKNIETVQARSRFRWKRLVESLESCNSHLFQIEANELAKLLVQVHDAMFKLDNFTPTGTYPYQMKMSLEQNMLLSRPYSRACFVFLLCVLKTHIITDWDKCLQEMHNGITVNESFDARYAEDLALNMHIFGVDDSFFTKPDPNDLNNPILPSALFSKFKDLPDMLCVTIQVPRQTLSFLSPESHDNALIVCSFIGAECLGKKHFQSFSSVQIAFGMRHKQTEEKDTHPIIDEDSAGLSGTSDMFASVIVPTSMLMSMLLQSKEFEPEVKCGIRNFELSLGLYQETLGPDLFFSSSKLISEDIFITRFMPRMSGLPKLAITYNHQDKATSDVTLAHISDDGLKIKSLSKRVPLESEIDKAEPAVNIEFKSPLTAVISVDGSQQFQLEFPVPVSTSNCTIDIDGEPPYIEVKSSFLDPVAEDIATFLVPCFLMKVPAAIVPVPWTSTYINLDRMPALVLNSFSRSWVFYYLNYVFSLHEVNIQESNSELNFRMLLKNGFLDLFKFYATFEGARTYYFELENEDSGHTLIVPSSLRLDLANNTIVLDCAWIPLTSFMKKEINDFLQELENENAVRPITVTEAENRAWKAMAPALVERCRTWKHKAVCEYVKAREAPLVDGVNDNCRSSICSCGLGKFPESYLQDQTKKFPSLGPILEQCATRVAISPIFAVPHVEDCRRDVLNRCSGCIFPWFGISSSCRCRMVSYCTPECEAGHTPKHRPFCTAE